MRNALFGAAFLGVVAVSITHEVRVWHETHPVPSPVVAHCQTKAPNGQYWFLPCADAKDYKINI